MTPKRDPQPGLQEGRPAPPFCPSGQGQDVFAFPRGHVRRHTVGMNHCCLPKPPTWKQPPGAARPGLLWASALHLRKRSASTPGTPRLSNPTEVSSGASCEAGDASPPGQRGRGVDRWHRGPSTPWPTPARGLTCRRGHGAGDAGAGAEKLGALVPPRRH